MEDQEFERDEQRLEARRLKRLEQKRKRLMQQRIVLGVLALILILVIVLIVRGCSKKQAAAAPSSSSAASSSAASSSASAVETKPNTVATLAAVGDIMVYDNQISDAEQADGTYSFDDCFKAISAYTMGADLTVGNLELNFCGSPYSGFPNFRAPESLAATLANVGFDLVQTANTYSIQNGMTGLQATIHYLDAAKIDHVGTCATEDERTETNGVVVKDMNGIKVAFIGFTKGVNNSSMPDGTEFAINLLYTDYSSNYSQVNEDAIVKQVEAAKAVSADVIVAMVHWGGEGDLEPVDTQTKIKDILFQNGVDVILGSHSHLVGPMQEEAVTTKDGTKKTCFVAYSLGNFLTGKEADGYNISCILNLQFTKDGETGETTISKISYLPVYIMDSGTSADVEFQVLPIRSAISSGLFPDQTQTMTDAIAKLRVDTDSDYDSGE
jgi:poly-gamma-glutamate capsule biosynthesis protein CapA/YwtB (metallophosphatase superfamily)